MAPASASHSHRQPYEYLDALLTSIPNDAIPPEITASPSQGGAGAHRPYSKFIDTALRLASGGPARPDDAPQIRDAWPEIQTSVQRALHALHPSSSSSSPSPQQPAKRKHSPSSLPSTINNNNNNNKKPKYEDVGDDKDDDDDDDDVPQLTLHAISATAPVRHKVDITLHARTLRLAHSTTGASTARCARTALTHVFLLPTRARSSGALQWTALLLAGDKPAPPAPRGGGAGGKEAKAKAKAVTTAAVRFELTCSVPDSSSPATIPRMTVHVPTSSSSSTSTPTSQVTSAREAAFMLLSSTISGTPVALTTVERGAPLAGITAFRGVRETSLWFFDDGANANAGAGILADARPAEFWALEDLARGEAGVRVRTATGRTCSVVLMRRRSGDGTGEGDEEEEEEEEGEETEFQMIDGKERERILEWVRRHRGAFGIAKSQGEDDEAQAQAQAPLRGAANGKDGGEDSDSDSNFEASGESDGGSPSSSNSGSDVGFDAGDAGTSEGESGSGNESGGEDDEAEGDDDEETTMDLDDPDPDPKHHPLLRAGALPKMSRAAMDAAVELVVGDLVGQGKDTPPAAGSGLELGLGRPAGDGYDEGAVAGAGAGDDDEEDELED
jgi:Histone chaperone Rttp106-like